MSEGTLSISSFAAPVCILNKNRFPLSADEVNDGGSLNVLRLVETLTKEGIKVEIFTKRRNGEIQREHKGLLTIYRVECNSSIAEHPMMRDYEEGESFLKGVFAHPLFWPSRYRALHVHHWSSSVGLPENVPPWIKMIFTPHLLAFEKSCIARTHCPEVVLESERRIISRADTIIALSQAEARSIQKLGEGGALNLIIAPNGVDDSFFNIPIESPYPERKIRLLTIARLSRQKGLELILDAMSIIIQRGCDVELTVVGGSYRDTAYESELRLRASVPLLRNRVRFVGSIPHTEIPKWLAVADIYVQPSYYESQSIALQEAMAAGRPVIASRLEAICEYLEEKIHGLMFTPGRADQLAEQIEKLFRSTQQTLEFAKAARQQARLFAGGATQHKVVPEFLNKNNRLPSGEDHDPILQGRLRCHAENRAVELARNPGVCAVLLTGSIIKGPVSPGSDVDLYILMRGGSSRPPAPPWSFLPEGIIENIHVMPIPLLKEGHALLHSDEALANWFCENPAGDHLVRSEVLVWNDDSIDKRMIDQLVKARQRMDISQLVALRYAERAASYLDTVQSLLQIGAVKDAHHILRTTVQLILIAVLSRFGWIQRGAKKRPEIASMYLPDKMVEAALDLLLNVVGLKTLTLSSAEMICIKRLGLRKLYLIELKRLVKKFDNIDSILERTIIHERNAVDYYQHAVNSNIFRGPVNHIRCLSGFYNIPMRLLGAIGQPSRTIVRDFQHSDFFSKHFKDTWLDLADLNSEPRLMKTWATNAENIVSDLRSECEVSRLYHQNIVPAD